jgi:hypothetical protein
MKFLKPELNSFPHHVHIGRDEVANSSKEMSIEESLKVIEQTKEKR